MAWQEIENIRWVTGSLEILYRCVFGRVKLIVINHATNKTFVRIGNDYLEVLPEDQSQEILGMGARDDKLF